MTTSSEEKPNIDELLAQRKASQGNALSDKEQSELSNKLNRRLNINDGQEAPASSEKFAVFNPYTEFKEFSRKDIQNFDKSFKKYDLDKDSYIGFEDLKYMMEKLGNPQTHLGLKQMIKDIDEDNDGKISFREFLTIFRRARSGETLFQGLMDLYTKYNEMENIEVHEVGVKEAKNFFQAKIEKITHDEDSKKEILQEQEQKKREAEERKQRKEEFKAKQSLFKA